LAKKIITFYSIKFFKKIQKILDKTGRYIHITILE